MCGRVVTTSSPGELSECMAVDEIVATLDGLDHNVAPTGQLPIVWDEGGGNPREPPSGRTCGDRVRRLGTARWGLVPPWAKDPSVGGRMFNARAETVAEKPSFRSAFAHRRCLVPIDGFYEWGPAPAGGPSRKQPWFVHRADGRPMVLAGLWERWSPPGGLPAGDDGPDGRDSAPVLHTCTVITVEANADMAPVHHRMPAVLEPGQWADWLEPDGDDPLHLGSLLLPAPAGCLERYRVDRRVDNARNKGPELLKPVAPGTDTSGGPFSPEALW